MSTIASKYSGAFFSSRKRSTTGSIGDDQESRTAGEVGNEGQPEAWIRGKRRRSYGKDRGDWR
jgi:hypothetical protein